MFSVMEIKYKGSCNDFTINCRIHYRKTSFEPIPYSPTDADAIAAATVQTSAVIVYTLYDSSWSQDVSSVSCIVV